MKFLFLVHFQKSFHLLKICSLDPANNSQKCIQFLIGMKRHFSGEFVPSKNAQRNHLNVTLGASLNTLNVCQ